MKSYLAISAISAALLISSAHAGDTLRRISENMDSIQNLIIAILSFLTALKKKKEN